MPKAAACCREGSDAPASAQVRAQLLAWVLSGTIHPLIHAARFSQLLVNHNAPEFVETRRQRLEEYVSALVCLADAFALPDVQAFLGLGAGRPSRPASASARDSTSTQPRSSTQSAPPPTAARAGARMAGAGDGNEDRKTAPPPAGDVPDGAVVTKTGGLKFTVTFHGGALGMTVRARPPPQQGGEVLAKGFDSVVSVVSDGGQASHNRVQAGDYLLAINGDTSLRQTPHKVAVAMIKTSPRPLTVRPVFACRFAIGELMGFLVCTCVRMMSRSSRSGDLHRYATPHRSLQPHRCL